MTRVPEADRDVISDRPVSFGPAGSGNFRGEQTLEVLTGIPKGPAGIEQDPKSERLSLGTQGIVAERQSDRAAGQV